MNNRIKIPPTILIGDSINIHNARVYFLFMFRGGVERRDICQINCTGQTHKEVEAKIENAKKSRVVVLLDIHKGTDPILSVLPQDKTIVVTSERMEAVSSLYEPFLHSSVIFNVDTDEEINVEKLLQDRKDQSIQFDLHKQTKQIPFDKETHNISDESQGNKPTLYIDTKHKLLFYDKKHYAPLTNQEVELIKYLNNSSQQTYTLKQILVDHYGKREDEIAIKRGRFDTNKSNIKRKCEQLCQKVGAKGIITNVKDDINGKGFYELSVKIIEKRFQS